MEMAKTVDRKRLDILIKEAKEATGWSWEVLAEQLRVAGVECTSRSLHRWGQGHSPHPNTDGILRVALRDFLK